MTATLQIAGIELRNEFIDAFRSPLTAALPTPAWKQKSAPLVEVVDDLLDAPGQHWDQVLRLISLALYTPDVSTRMQAQALVAGLADAYARQHQDDVIGDDCAESLRRYVIPAHQRSI